MAYATPADLIAAYGETLALALTDRSGMGVVDELLLTAKLAAASSLIDSHLKNYPRPIPNPPEFIRQTCIDIAVYWTANTADLVSDEMRKRFDDARETLKRISNGEIDIGPVDVDGDGAPDVGGGLLPQSLLKVARG